MTRCIHTYVLRVCDRSFVHPANRMHACMRRFTNTKAVISCTIRCMHTDVYTMTFQDSLHTCICVQCMWQCITLHVYAYNPLTAGSPGQATDPIAGGGITWMGRCVRHCYVSSRMPCIHTQHYRSPHVCIYVYMCIES